MAYAQPAAISLRATLRHLEAIARAHGTPVRYDAIAQPRRSEGELVRGGLCRVHGRAMIVCDASLPVVDKVVVVAEVLSGCGIELLTLPPILRARLGRSSVRRAR